MIHALIIKQISFLVATVITVALKQLNIFMNMKVNVMKNALN